MKLHFSIVSRSLLALISVAAITSCADEPVLDNATDSSRILLPGEYRFIISRDDDNSLSAARQSRVNYETITSSRFATGDEIGVFSSNSDKQIQNDVFAARNIDDNSEIQVLAPPVGKVTQGLDTVIPDGDNIRYLFYYPMNKTWEKRDIIKGTGFSYSVQKDQTEKEDYEHSDFLWNYHISEPGAAYQTIHMHHLMANIVVKIHKDSIDTTDGRGVTLRNFPTTATGIKFETQTNGEMNYTIQVNSRDDIKMYLADTSGKYLIYRAAVPAWHTINAGDDIITCTLFDRGGSPVEVTYKMAKDILLRDGYYYTFTLGSSVKPAVPDVTDEESWVLDVFDPETNEVVGLLCREYLRYQPDHTGSDNIDMMDELTGTPTPDGKSRYITSQAWVFYNLKNVEKKIPDLKYGTVMRFIYDIRASFNGTQMDNTASAWPAPHTYGVAGNDVAQGLFLADHGHTWVKGPTSGQSSEDYVEHYMHGGSITWEATQSPEGHAYHHISDFKMPDEQITNVDAYNYGHIAIRPDGSVGVSYAKFTGDVVPGGEVVIDDENCKVAYVLEHYLYDEDDSNGLKYPIVKIGYNNFWMSKSLHRNSQSGMHLVCLNGDEDDPYKEYMNPTEALPAGYFYPFSKEYDFAVLRDCPDKENFPLLYNYTAISDPNFVPTSSGDIVPDDRFDVYLPNADQFYHILHYFGRNFKAKLMTSKVRTRLSYNEYGETIKDALMEHKIVHENYNAFAGNVSGFNLRTDGEHFYNAGMNSFGFSCALWVDNDYYTANPGPMRTMSFSAWGVFDTSSVTDAFTDYIAADVGPVQKSANFFAVRFSMKMKEQESSSEIISPASRSTGNSQIKTQATPNRYVSVNVVK